jgi:hypothetical protein
MTETGVIPQDDGLMDFWISGFLVLNFATIQRSIHPWDGRERK